MFAKTTVTLGFLIVAVACASRDASAAPVLLSTDYRYAAQADKSFSHGEATVAKSQLFERGLRLAGPPGAAGDKGGPGQAVATAVYRFEVPLAAKSFIVEVGYRADAAAKDREIAGLLLVRNRDMEAKAAELAKERKLEGGKPDFLGNTYFLPGNKVTTSFTLPAESHVVEGVLEVRLAATAGQAFDAQYVEVKSYRSVENIAGPPGPLGYPAGPAAVFGGPSGSMDPFFWRQFLPPTTIFFDGHRHRHRDRDRD